VAPAERREMAASAGRGRTTMTGARCACYAKRHGLAFSEPAPARLTQGISASSAISALMLRHQPHNSVTMGRKARLQIDGVVPAASKA